MQLGEGWESAIGDGGVPIIPGSVGSKQRNPRASEGSGGLRADQAGGRNGSQQ